jgi:hypothetical protein
MTWLCFGIIFGPILGIVRHLPIELVPKESVPENELVADAEEPHAPRPLYDYMDEVAPASDMMWTSLIFTVPAIGIFVVVGQMLSAYGSVFGFHNT